MLLLVIVIELLTITGNFCVEIVFNNPQLITSCAKDLRSGRDEFVLTGTIGPNVSEATTTGWAYSVSVQIFTRTSLRFVEICPIFLGPNGVFCGPTVDLCNCDSIDANGTAHFSIKSAALQDHSEGIIRGEWRNSNGTDYHSVNLTLPHIYDVTKATLELKVNNQAAVVPSDSCGSNFISNEVNTVELCCSNTASPCYPRMFFSDGVVIENQAMCVHRTFNPHNESFTVNVTASYSVCTKSDYITRGSCQIDTSEETSVDIITIAPTSISTRNFGVEIFLNNPQLITPCAKDLRSGTDKYVLTGTIGPNVSEALTAGWKTTVSVQILTRTSHQFVDICQILLGPGGAFCSMSAVRGCNCDYVDANGAAHIRVNTTALLENSEGIVRGAWQNNNGTYCYSGNITLPHIYDVTKASLELKVNNKAAVVPSDSCGSNFISNEVNIVELCCSNTASPCYPRMSFSDGVVIENQAMCSHRTFKPLDESFTVNVTASYSVCTLNDYMTRGSCLIKTSKGKRNFGVEIAFNNPQLITPCVKDLRSGTDQYVLTGTIGPNVSEAITTGWKYSVSVQILTRTSLQFVEICPILLEPAVIFCRPAASLCNCDSVDANGAAHIRINSAALQDHSEGIIRVEWQNSNGNYYHSVNLTLPHIYDVTKATVELKGNNKGAVVPSDSCGSNFISNKDNTVELCCSNTVSPCYPRMSFSDGVVIENQTMCARRTFKPLDESFTVNMTASFSVCTKSDYITRGSCLIETSKGTSTEINVGAVAGGIVAGILVIVAVALIVLFLKRKGQVKRAANDRCTDHGKQNLTFDKQEGSCYKNIPQGLPETDESPSTQYEEIRDVQLDIPDKSTDDADSKFQGSHYENIPQALLETDESPSTQYEEIRDVQLDIPDKSTDDADSKFQGKQDKVVEYENTVSAL